MNREEALNLHREALVIDSHNDSIVAHIRRGNLGLGGEWGPERAGRAGVVAYLRQYLYPFGEGIQLDIPRMRAGGIDAAFFAVDTTRPWGNHLLYAMDALGYLVREVEEHPADLRIARRAEDLIQAKREGKLALLLAIENSNALEQSPHVLPLLYQLGVRTMTLTHSDRAWAGDGCEVENGGGLTRFGRTVVAQMNELGMLVDVSHLNERGFWDVLDCSEAPVIASHSCCRSLCDHPRNLSDEQLRALAEKGGVVGLTFVPSFVDARAPSLERLLDHLDHAMQVAGIDSVGLGSDFDGGGDLLPDAAAYPEITLGLAGRGYPPEALRKILGENHLRLLRQVIG
ncbi:MAG: membrane dipeptidase [Candidatus Latescibacteria bacterium]|nr:membrane dipeptidase [Candidatus Latescibacterota bacterium]